ncbi:hypothetical protein ABZ438_10395 [Streptomyces sp. NPDC005786]|uniref:hypothetical protein n=1 Tax=Streptomyces sp. NPDC005786 TaxID=3154891 RepID=UPI0033EBEBB5
MCATTCADDVSGLVEVPALEQALRQPDRPGQHRLHHHPRRELRSGTLTPGLLQEQA